MERPGKEYDPPVILLHSVICDSVEKESNMENQKFTGLTVMDVVRVIKPQALNPHVEILCAVARLWTDVK